MQPAVVIAAEVKHRVCVGAEIEEQCCNSSMTFVGCLSPSAWRIASPQSRCDQRVLPECLRWRSRAVERSGKPRLKLPPLARSKRPSGSPSTRWARPMGLQAGAVLYTTYLPLTTNSWYNSWIAPFQSEIATNMQACASPGLYFEVSPTQGIADAMTALFKKAVATARITQ
jgi:hypothetical protein